MKLTLVALTAITIAHPETPGYARPRRDRISISDYSVLADFGGGPSPMEIQHGTLRALRRELVYSVRKLGPGTRIKVTPVFRVGGAVFNRVLHPADGHGPEGRPQRPVWLGKGGVEGLVRAVNRRVQKFNAANPGPIWYYLDRVTLERPHIRTLREKARSAWRAVLGRRGR
jgi:hypothetical protein